MRKGLISAWLASPAEKNPLIKDAAALPFNIQPRNHRGAWWARQPKMDKHVSSLSVQMTVFPIYHRNTWQKYRKMPLWRFNYCREGRAASLFGRHKLNGLFAEQIGVWKSLQDLIGLKEGPRVMADALVCRVGGWGAHREPACRRWKQRSCPGWDLRVKISSSRRGKRGRKSKPTLNRNWNAAKLRRNRSLLKASVFEDVSQMHNSTHSDS